jgi:gamma-glutamyltranspeptidase
VQCALACTIAALLLYAPHGARAADPAPQAGHVPASEEFTIPAESLLGDVATSRLGMIVTDSPAASQAGALMLESGGNAFDAAVAAAFALGVALPGSSGLGGQTVMLVRLASGRIAAVDGSARAPLRSSTHSAPTVPRASPRCSLRRSSSPSSAPPGARRTMPTSRSTSPRCGSPTTCATSS